MTVHSPAGDVRRGFAGMEAQLWTYTIRVPGQTAWAEGVPYEVALKEMKNAPPDARLICDQNGEDRTDDERAVPKWANTSQKSILLREYPVLEFFAFDHLPPGLAEVGERFCDLAYHTAQSIQSHPELTKALDRLLEAKDAAVRAAMKGLPF